MRIDVAFDITTEFTVSDTGYTRSMTLPEVEKWAKEHISCLQLFIKEGGTESKPVRAKFNMKHIRFVPDAE